MNATQKEYTDKEFEDYLSDTWGDVEICGGSYAAGYALKEVDPIAFNCARNDLEPVYICGECDTEYDNKEEAEECCKEEGEDAE